MYFIFSIGISYMLYRRGVQFLFRSKLLLNNKASLLAYVFLMLSGVTMGEYLSITFLPFLYEDVSKWSLILITTLVSIIFGEFVYNTNYRMVNRIVTNHKD